MINGFEEIQKSGKESMDLAMKSFGTFSKGLQAIAVEMADYSKKSFEDSSATVEKLFGAKSFDKALEIQTDYAKSSYEGFVAQSTKIGELFADLAKEAYKPVETMVSKAAK
ncbi:MAG: phasin family protein [Tepidamorphaceae bacterium]|nr:phasin family protein [Rhodobiaceae bacterium]MCC0048796.1 phasin family protein [Rhodobiaceae bacterium]